MPITKQWPGGATNATPTSFSLPLNNELNWLQLTSFLQSLADSAQGTTFQKFKVRVVTASPDTISATADCILAVNVAGAVTINLPAGAEKQIFFIVDSSGAAATNNITITPNGSETVRGGASLVLNKNYQGVVLAFTGTDWKAFGPFTTPGSITDADFTGQLSTAKGGTGQNSTATFPTSGTVATVPSAGVVKSSGTALTSSNVNLTSEVTGTLPVANGGTGITSFGTGVATFLGTPSSANLASAVTDETGTGALVFANTPTLVTPILGTPQSATLTNATGLPIDAGTTGTLPASRGGTGVTSLGTGVATALGQNVTGSGSIVLSGSPTFTGTPISPSLQISGTAGAGFVELAEQDSSPSTPASGFARMFTKGDNKLYLKDDAGVETQLGAGGVGEINVVENPSDANNWGTSNATVTTTTTAANLPLGPLVDTAIEITSSTSGGYARYRWTMPVSLRQRKLKVAWQQVAATLTSGDYKVEVYKNSASDYSGSYTEFSLSTDSSGTSSIPNLNGQYQTTFDADDGIYYELRVVRTAASSATIRLAGVTVGPGIQPQGAVIGEPQAYSPTVSNITNINTQFWWQRIGSNIRIWGGFNTTATPGGTGNININLLGVLNLTADLTKIKDQIRPSVTTQDSGLGYAYASYYLDTSTSNPLGQVRLVAGSSTTVEITSTVGTAGIWSRGSNIPGTWGYFTNANLDNLFLDVTIPIAEWASSGTVQLAQNDVELSFNSSTTDADDTTSFGYGPSGNTVPNISGATNRVKRVRFQTPIQTTDIITIEVKPGSSGEFSTFLAAPSGTTTGISWAKVNATDIDVTFGFSGNNANTAFGTATWATRNSSNWTWRVRKSSAGAAVGFGIVSSSSAGLLPVSNSNLDDATATRLGLKQYLHGTTYNGGNAPNVTLSSGGGTLSSIVRAIFIPYQTQDGAWRMRFTIMAKVSSTARVAAAFAVNGATVKNITDYYQGITGGTDAVGAYVVSGYTDPATNTIGLYHTSALTSQYRLGGDIELESKPTWAY